MRAVRRLWIPACTIMSAGIVLGLGEFAFIAVSAMIAFYFAWQWTADRRPTIQRLVKRPAEYCCCGSWRLEDDEKEFSMRDVIHSRYRCQPKREAILSD